jgi:hypothetical protein
MQMRHFSDLSVVRPIDGRIIERSGVEFGFGEADVLAMVHTRNSLGCVMSRLAQTNNAPAGVLFRGESGSARVDTLRAVTKL